MSETQLLLSRIAALRRQLEQAQGPPASVSRSLTTSERETQAGLERQVARGSKETVLLDTVLRQLTPALSVKEPPTLPKQLTSRARRILEQGRELLGQLRSLADEFEPPGGERRVRSTERHDDPLTQRYHETAAMANTALRMFQTFPDAASAQLSLCQGLEAILGLVTERIAGISAVLGRRRREAAQLEILAGLLTTLHAKEPVNIQSFVNLAEQLLAEAQQTDPLRFLYVPPGQPAQFVASHSLTVARVLARLVRHDADFRSDPVGPVVAALLFDAGMLGVPSSILAQPGPLDDAQRRALEAHTRLGAELMTQILPTGSWLAEIAAGHHERLDGTGYPAGRQEGQLDTLTRLVAVCDVYAALCTPRPHRSALDTRTALADTLLLAEQGALDRYHAERLLCLSFYPVGAVVELADGAFGVVVATPNCGALNAQRCARPILALLTDTQGQLLPVPQHLDLAECDHRSIVRTVPKSERSTLLGSRYPELD